MPLLKVIQKRTVKLSLEGESLPSEFRLFVKGWNDTENGRFLFDEAAAKSVMAAYAAWGVDLMIDLEHQSLEVKPGGPDPTARDARGWCRLELRPDGSLWACDVKWTPDGAKRLQSKTQRYISPAFETDPKTKRVMQMINVAMVAMPATHKTPALVAAARKALAKDMDPSLIKQALDAIEKGDAKTALEILKGMIASAAGAEPTGDGEGDEGSADDGAEGVAPPPDTESVEDPKIVDNAAPPPPAKDGSSDDSDDEDDDSPAKKTARKAMRRMLCRITGKPSFAEAVAEVEIFRASHVTLETERKQLARERAALESAERRRLVVDLVTLGAEFPATVWVDPLAKGAKALKPRWLAMPIETLRSHVKEQKLARGEKKPAGPNPPAGGQVDEHGLTEAELKICKQYGTEPKDFAMLKARRDGKKDS